MPVPSPKLCLGLLLATAAALFCAVHAAPSGAADDRQGPELTLGVTADATSAAQLPAYGAEGAGPIVRVVIAASQVEHEPGVYDWSLVGPAVTALANGRYRIAFSLVPDSPLYGSDVFPAAGPGLEDWLRFVRSAVRRFGDRVETFQIGDRLDSHATPSAVLAPSYAFFLKQSALAARAEAQARGVEVQVAQATVDAEDLELQREVWAQDVAPYIDVLPVGFTAGGDPDSIAGRIDAFAEASLAYPPAPQIWAVVESSTHAPWSAEQTAVAALAGGAAAALIGGAAAEPVVGESVRWVLWLHALLARGYAPAPLGTLSLEDEQGGPWPQGRLLGRFFDEETFSTAIAYHAPEVEGRSTARLVVDTALLRDPRVFDPRSGDTVAVAAAPRADAGRVAVEVSTGQAPLAVLFEIPAASPGLAQTPEQLEVATGRGLTAEEIIARHRQVQRAQDDHLERWIAHGRVDLHFKLAQGGASVDVAIDSTYFWERGGTLEWEQTDYYINGNRVNWKNIPELPLIQPEKVVTLPLDLTLDRTYSYRLVHREPVDGRDAYVLEFQPAAPDSSLALYRGRVWIDAETFARSKVSLIQTSMDPPVLSNEEVDRYQAVQDAEGLTYSMLSEIDGQQVWNTVGRTFVVRRELGFDRLEINPPLPTFTERRRVAYASSNQMLRDTERGFRYLERQEDGSRVVKEQVDSSQWFAGGGAFRDSSTDGATPLAGVNYFNYDLGGRNIQLNAFLAGVVGFFTASKPDLFGGRADVTLDAAYSLLKFDDKVFLGDDEALPERLETRSQHAAIRFGVPIGKFFKASVIGGLTLRQYADDEEAEDARGQVAGGPPTFVLPADHVETTAAVEGEMNRRGYSLRGSITRARRSEWEPWGLRDAADTTFGHFDPQSGTFAPGGEDPLRRSFTHWDLTAFKEWYLPRFQKLRGEIDYLDGADFDRFSRYQFTFFGDQRLDGFSGSGVRFEDGVIVRAGYSFNLFEAVRFDAALATARVRRETGGDRQAFTGAGLSGNVVGPWKTVISVSYGRAIAADIADLEGGQEFMVLVLKLF